MPTKSLRAPVLAEIGDRVKSRPPWQKRDRLDGDDKLLILFGTCRAWTIKKIALTLPAVQQAREANAAPTTAKLSASVPPDVKMT